mgnify:CR=1 FL=1
MARQAICNGITTVFHATTWSWEPGLRSSDNARGLLEAIEALRLMEDGRYRQVSVNVQLTANIEALRKIMHRIENGTPVLFIDNLTVRPLNAFRGFRPAPGAEPEVSVLLDVSGFALAEGDKK